MSILKKRSSEDGALPTMARIKGVPDNTEGTGRPLPQNKGLKDNTEGTGRPLPQNKGVKDNTEGTGRPLPQNKGEPLSQNIVRKNKQQGKRGVDKRLRAALQSDSPTNPQQLNRIKKFAKRKGLGKHYVEKYIRKQGTNLLQKK